MKKVLQRTILLMLVFSLLVSNVVFATDTNNATFSMEDATVKCGENVEIMLSVSSTCEINGMLLDTLSYNKDLLEFVEFASYGDLITTSALGANGVDSTIGEISLGYTDPVLPNGQICKLVFKTKAIGETTVSINALLSKGGAPIDNVVSPKCTVTIEGETMTGITFEDATYTYDGTEKKIEVTGNFPDGYKIYYSEDKNSATDVGTYEFKADVTAPGYNDLNLKATLTINPKEVSVTGLTAADKTYDGTTDATLSGGVLEGVLEADKESVSANVSTAGTFTSANAGNNIAVTFEKIVLSGEKAGNYELKDQPTVTANITKVPLTLTAIDNFKKEGTKEPELKCDVKGEMVFPDTLKVVLEREIGEAVGKYAITAKEITIGGNKENYDVTFTPGVFTIVDKTPQNITVDGIVTEKTYGDDGFKITVTPDGDSKLDNFAITSSNTDVAEIDASGNVTIKNAGTTTISVKEPGNDEYAAFDKSWTLTVNKVKATITADNASKIIGQKDPELTYKAEVNLVGEDKIEGALAREEGEEVGKYDITIGTLKINDNYDITFNKGVFEIVPKTAQTITVAAVDAKTYGDESFKLDVTADEGSKLDTFTYASSDEKVVTVDKDGNVTIVGVGKATITVTQAGDETYAEATATAEITVNAKNVEIASVDMGEKTAEITGVLEADKDAVKLDFDKIKTTVLSSESKPEGEKTIVTTKLDVTNLILKGDKAANYAVAADAVVKAEVTTETIAEKLTEDENVTIEAAKVDDKTVVVTDVEIAKNEEDETPKSDTVVIDATKVKDAIVNAIAILKDIVEKIVEEVAEKAGLEITVNADSDAEGQKATITLDAKALETISEESSTVLTISVEKPEKEELPDEQAKVLEEVKDNAPVVYSIGLVDDKGNEVVAKENGGFGEGKAKVKLPYKKPDGKGKVKVKHVKDDGTTEEIKDAKYDNEFVEVDLKHFSEYLIYTEADNTPVKPSAGGGGGGLTAGGDKSNANADKLGNDDKTENPEEAPVVTPSTPAGFADLAGYAWAEDAITNLVEKGIIKGTSATTYSPANNIIRADFVALVVRMFNLTSAESENFADVNASDYFARELAIARNSGIVGGVGDNKFAPRGNITRQDMMVMLYRAMQKLDIQLAGTQTQNVSDLDTVSEYAKEAVEVLMANGIITGKNGKIDPKANATRAEVAVMLNRVLDLVK